MRFHALLLCCLLAHLVAAEPTYRADVVTGKAGNRDIHLDLCLPGQGAGPFPLLVWIHGGGWHGGSHHDYRNEMRGFAAAGYASASLEYRLAPEARWPAQLSDLKLGLRHLRDAAPTLGLDLQRVAVLGGSAGGHLALMVGFDAAPTAGIPIRAIVNISGPTQLGLFTADPRGDAELKAGSGMDSRQLVADFLGNDDRSAAIYAEASPLTWVRPGVPPVLTLHGTEDRIVPVSQAEALHAALRHITADEVLILGAAGGHDLGAWAKPEQDRGIAALTAFLAHRLRKP